MYFQAHSSFTFEEYPALDPRIGKLTVELQSLNYEQLNQVWAFIGGKQLPSAIYKFRMVVLQDDVQTAIPLLIKATNKLETTPRIGRIVPELENYGFREVIYQNYRIVYRVIGDEDVEIFAVLHGARNFKKAFHEESELS